ncbi:MAG: hypothetical protein HGA45_35220 [Chloroflexales bacterium]|nr:hypothetical protein [Chloroflexales bacterium]
MNIRDVVLRHLAATVEHYSPVQFPHNVADEMRLDRFWIDSVGFAALMSSLEAELGYIPLVLLEGAYYPETFGGLVAIYEEAASTRSGAAL